MPELADHPPRLDPTETKVPSDSNLACKPLGSLDALCDGTGLPNQVLSQVFRHSGWAAHRRLVYDALMRLRASVSAIVGFADCGSEAYVVKSDGDPPEYRIAGSACHHRFCNPCATERARTIAQNVIDRIGTNRVRFITFTLKHAGESLRELLDRLYASFRAMQRTKLWKTHVTGGVGFLEVKYVDDSESWHPHFHVLVEGKYIDKLLLQQAWLAITGDSFVVDIRLPKGKRNVAHYVAKYASKPLNSSFLHQPVLLDEAILAVKGRRLCTTFGGWRGVLLVDKPDEGGWTNVGPLTDWIRRAVHGDDNARKVLDGIDAGRAALCYHLAPLIEPRPPPEKPPPKDPQLLLVTSPYTYDALVS